MTEKVFIRILIYKFLGFWLALAFCSSLLGQGVPVEQIEAPAVGQNEFADSDIGLGFLSSDPLELSSVDGLDDPLERLRLRDSDTGSILDMIQLITQRYILRPQNLPNVKINFDSFSILTKRETLRALESLLAMNGVGITKIDERFYKAVPAAGMNVHVPIWLDGPALALKPSQRIYVKMFPLSYAPAIEVREQLNPFSTPNIGTLLVFEKANSILATDSLLNLQRMEKLLESIDRPISAEELGTEFYVHNTQHAGARELEGKLRAMIDGSLKSFLGGTTQVDSDERTGKLIVVTRKENIPTIEFILQTLDAPVKMKTSSKLFKLQHAEALEITKILDEVINNQKQIKQKLQKNSIPNVGQKNTAAKPPTPGSPKTNNTQSTQGAGNADGGDSSHEFSDFISISADERSNAILVYGTKGDIEEVGKMISSLDEPLPLARIDTIFVMVDLSEQNQRGIDALFGGLEWSKYARGERGENLFGEVTNINVPGSDGSTTISTPKKTNSFQGVLGIPGINSSMPFQMEDWKLTGLRWDQIFSLSSERNDVRIFSTPSLMVSHNAPEVHILIEDERNIVIPTYYGNTSTDSTSTGSAEKITAKTSLEIKKPKIGLPLIDENGTIISKGSIFMEVEVKAEKFDETQSNTYQGQNLPGKKVREAKSFVTIRDQEIIVLGGL
jgi:general secretion pathway protein D